MNTTLPEKIHDEITRLAISAKEAYGLTCYQQSAVENLMYRAANAVLTEQSRQREYIAREMART